MLFELHDIILHRLYKWRMRLYREYMRSTQKVDVQKMTRLSSWAYRAKYWYLNHQRRYTTVGMVRSAYYEPPQYITINKVKAEHVSCG